MVWCSLVAHWWFRVIDQKVGVHGRGFIKDEIVNAKSTLDLYFSKKKTTSARSWDGFFFNYCTVENVTGKVVKANNSKLFLKEC